MPSKKCYKVCKWEFFQIAKIGLMCGVEHVRMDCVASGPHPASYKKTPATYMNIFTKAQA